MVNSMTDYMALCWPSRGVGYLAIKGLFLTVTFPLKYIDALLVRLPRAHEMASALYFVGRKPCGR